MNIWLIISLCASGVSLIAFGIAQVYLYKCRQALNRLSQLRTGRKRYERTMGNAMHTCVDPKAMSAQAQSDVTARYRTRDVP